MLKEEDILVWLNLSTKSFQPHMPYFNIEQKRKRKPDLKKQHYYVFET